MEFVEEKTATNKLQSAAWITRQEGDPGLAISYLTDLVLRLTREQQWAALVEAFLELIEAYRDLGNLTENSWYTETAHAVYIHAEWILDTYKLPPPSTLNLILGEIWIDLKRYELALRALDEYLHDTKFKSPSKEWANVMSLIGFARFKFEREGLNEMSSALAILEDTRSQNIYLGKDVYCLWRIRAMLRLAECLGRGYESRGLANGAANLALQHDLGLQRTLSRRLLKK
jgi:hypothetical protein